MIGFVLLWGGRRKIEYFELPERETGCAHFYYTLFGKLFA